MRSLKTILKVLVSIPLAIVLVFSLNGVVGVLSLPSDTRDARPEAMVTIVDSRAFQTYVPTSTGFQSQVWRCRLTAEYWHELHNFRYELVWQDIDHGSIRPPEPCGADLYGTEVRVKLDLFDRRGVPSSDVMYPMHSEPLTGADGLFYLVPAAVASLLLWLIWKGLARRRTSA